jgi:hypothetical protein
MKLSTFTTRNFLAVSRLRKQLKRTVTRTRRKGVLSKKRSQSEKGVRRLIPSLRLGFCFGRERRKGRKS